MKTTRQVILGTAGHIDHGKTALVKALTGVDTDRLKEEKERGITTELGFTFLDLPSGIRLGIIDVPGHERFVRHMVAGAWGIDLVALIIAADEGVMPQTREHLDICSLLKVNKGLIVLSKTDLVDRDLLELVTEEVTEVVRGTFLNGAPILPVSALTREGIPELIASIDALANQVKGRSSEGLLRLPIDRVFVMKGFGTVVTGTLVSGTLDVGDTVQVVPTGLEAKVRNLQVYNQAVERAVAGQRTAVNLQGIETSAIERGEVLAKPGTIHSTQVIDAFLEYLTSAPRPLKHRSNLRFHVGTSISSTSVFLLDRDEMVPGGQGFVQFRFDRPRVVLPQDRFVIRDVSATQTLGGGIVLDIRPMKHKRHSPSVVQELKLLKEGSGDQILGQYIARSGAAGVSSQELRERVAMEPRQIETTLEQMREKGKILFVDSERTKAVDHGQYQRLRDSVVAQLSEFHQRFPMKPGLAKEELRTKLPEEMDVRLYQTLLNGLIQSQAIVAEKDKLRLSGHRVSSTDEKGLIDRAEKALLHAGLQPPSPKELSEQWSVQEADMQAVFEHLAHEGTFVKIRSGMYFHRVPFEQLKEELIRYLRKNREITTPQFKEITAGSRKFAIPLIEYFDQIKLTLRIGDKRVLRASAQHLTPQGSGG
jgi:selenocysteine-specific elongation factor